MLSWIFKKISKATVTNSDHKKMAVLPFLTAQFQCIGNTVSAALLTLKVLSISKSVLGILCTAF